MLETVLKTFRPRSAQIAALLKPKYSATDLRDLSATLASALEISLNPLGRVCASTRATEGEDATNYDAVWVRDSVWAYFGLLLNRQTQEDARQVLLGLIRYFSTPEQIARQKQIIECPKLAKSEDGSMAVPHIRFDGRSSSFADVQVGGRDQKWNHKQNDAVALFAIAVGEALQSGTLDPNELAEEAWEFLLRLPTYWHRVEYYSQEDAGAWEEIERVNSSSVGLVTSSLELWADLVRQPVWRERFLMEAMCANLEADDEVLFGSELAGLIDRGYERLQMQLPFESPAYAPEGLKYRKADAALLNLIYPCKLGRLTLEQKRAVLREVSVLVREMGVIRYEGDAYQSGNYWKQSSEATTSIDARTDDHSGEGAFSSRAQNLIPGTEAQWFFDSWISQCYGILYLQTGEPSDLERQVAHFNRALCQITGNGEVGADGKRVQDFSLPESYNLLVEGEAREFAPSPITPLNWSKACLALAIKALRLSIQAKNN